MVEQPSGTVTLVFTDIEGSTRLLRELGRDAYQAALAKHRRIIRSACARHAGYEVDYEGDAFFYAFASADQALAALAEAFAQLDAGPICVRAGVHTGEPGLDPPKYVGMDVHLAARVMAAGHGGQVVITRSTRDLVGRDLKDLGEHRLRDINDPVWLYQLGNGDFPPLRSLNNSNLPTPASSFHGREFELEDADHLFSECRLLTISGPGGAGKTRFAIELASRRLSRFPNGIFWVPLAALRDPALVVETIAQAIGAKGGLAEHIGSRRMLLVLDNFEQVVEAAPQLSVLLAACPQLSLLVTSRELLRVQGEVEFALPPLATAEAVGLFCARVRCAPDATIEQLCQRLEGLPLALELAAARMPVFTPEELLERLGERLDLLRGGRDTDPRQQTLRATMEWSYDLLSHEEARLFSRLAMFAGGCTLDAAEQVCDAGSDTLQSLVEKSLLRHTEDRFWMLETIREFARERLGVAASATALWWTFATHFSNLAEELEPLVRREDVSALDRLEREHDNFRAVLEWTQHAHEPKLTARLSASLGWFWSDRGHWLEGKRWLEECLANYKQPDELRTTLLKRVVLIYGHLGRYELCESAARESLQLCKHRGDAVGEGWALAFLACAITQTPSRLAEGEKLLLRSELIARETGQRDLLAYVCVQAGETAVRMAESEEAKRRLEEGYDLYCELGYESSAAWASMNLAFVFLKEGDNSSAAELLRRTCDFYSRVENRGQIAYALIGLAAVFADRGEEIRPARLLGNASRIEQELGLVLEPVERTTKESTRQGLLAKMGEKRFGIEFATGSGMSVDDSVAFALDRSCQADPKIEERSRA